LKKFRPIVNKMTDIFEAKISCKNCSNEMDKIVVNKNGFGLRAVECGKCGDKIIHPSDKQNFEHFNNIRGKTFNVKLRMVGNSHAISIPKEIVNFINEMHSDMREDMDDMVRLCFEDFGRLSVRFDDRNERRKWQ
jgi:ribosomal protein S27E